jgi:hypothetical protein
MLENNEGASEVLQENSVERGSMSPSSLIRLASSDTTEHMLTSMSCCHLCVLSAVGFVRRQIVLSEPVYDDAAYGFAALKIDFKGMLMSLVR